VNILSVENLAKAFNERVLFSDLTFGLSQGDKMAIVGANGAGKSTLLKMIANLLPTDSGGISIRKGIKVSYLHQQPELPEGATALDIILSGDNPKAEATKNYLHFMDHPEKYADEASDILQAMEDHSAWDFEQRAIETLGSLSIHDHEQQVSSMSGGQRKRVALAQLLLSDPELILLDEPTNHLDLQAIEWLENTLSTANTTLILITHDRYFLDKVCNGVFELADKKIYRYVGNYAYFLEQKELRRQILQSEIEKAKNLYTKELEWMRKQPRARGTKARYRVEAFEGIKDKAFTKVDDTKLELSVSSMRMGTKIVEMEKINKQLGGKTLIKDFTHTFQRRERVGLVGRNGVGKSTFLNIITQNLLVDSGRFEVGQTIKFGYYTQESINLTESNRVIDEVKAIAEYITLGNGEQVSASKLLEMFLFAPKDQYGVIGKLSGGERRRLQLLKVLIANPNFLILDEPTNDLDIETLNVLQNFLENYDGCLMLVSHDRYFMDQLVDHLFVFEGEGKIKDFPGNYTDYREWLVENRQMGVSGGAPKETSTLSPKEKEKLDADKGHIEAPDPLTQIKKKMSYKEQKELETLDKDIPALEAKKAELESQLANGGNHETLQKLAAELEKLTNTLEEKGMRWLELSEMV
jgi:ATP-binding cassette subfamily F protein uup